MTNPAEQPSVESGERRCNRVHRELIERAVQSQTDFREVEARYFELSHDLHQAVQDAVDGGVSKAALARALGVTRERVQAMTRRT